MNRFADVRTEAVYRNGLTGGVPKHVGHRGHWIIHLLTAAHDWQDVGVIGRVARWAKYPGRFGFHVDGKWFITFTWETSVGAMEIKLERR